MLVPSGLVPVTGPRTKEGMIVASSKPSFLLSSQAFFSATVCNEQVEQSALTYLLNSAVTTTFATIETSAITKCWLKPKHVQFVAPNLLTAGHHATQQVMTTQIAMQMPNLHNLPCCTCSRLPCLPQSQCSNLPQCKACHCWGLTSSSVRLHVKCTQSDHNAAICCFNQTFGATQHTGKR